MPELVPASATLVRAPGWPWTHLLQMRRDPLALLRAGAAPGADVVELSFGWTRALVFYDPTLANEVFVPGEGLWKGSRGSQLLRRILGAGLLTTDGVAWRERRRRAQPRFRHEALRTLPGVVEKHAAALVDGWRGDVEAWRDLSALALHVVCEALFGVPPAEDGPVVHEALSEVLDGFLGLMTSPIPNLDRWPVPSARRHRAAVARLDAVVDRLITRRRALPPGGDLLSDWIDATDRGEMDQADLRAEVVTMLLAGHETTANAMAFTLALLGTHPDVQTQVREGLLRGDHAPLDRAFQESLRLFPPAWAIARATSERVEARGIVAEAGTFLFVPIAAIHRDPRWWSEPDAFRPDRWLEARPAQKAAFLPFGVGPRKCIGEHFARTEARIVLSAVLRAFEVRASEVPAPEASVTLRPRGGAHLQLHRLGAAHAVPDEAGHPRHHAQREQREEDCHVQEGAA